MFEISVPTNHSIKQQTQEKQQEVEAVEIFLELEDNHTIDFLVEKNIKDLKYAWMGFFYYYYNYFLYISTLT